MKLLFRFFILVIIFTHQNLFAQLVWSPQNSGSSTQFIDMVDFVDENIGFTLMFPDKILSTTNGGTTWTSTTLPGTNLNAISFSDSQNGWVIDYATAKIYKTTNGGTSWFPVYTNPFFSGNAYEVQFVDANFGWATRTDRLLFTTNGGNTWDSIPAFGGVPIQFVNQLTGFTLNGNYLYRSTNGGVTWTLNLAHTGSEYLNDFYALNETKLWAVGENGLIKKSINGGTSWTTLSVGSYGNLSGIRFFDLNNGIIAGAGGLVLTTIDGGNTWVTNTPITGSNLYSIEMMGPGLAWITGADGTIIKSFADTDVFIENYSGNTIACVGAGESISINVKNQGTSPINMGEFTLTGNLGSSLSYPLTTTLLPGIVTPMTIGIVTILGTETFTVTFTGDALTTNNYLDFTIAGIVPTFTLSGPHLVCPTDSVTLTAMGGLYYEWPGYTSLGGDSTLTVTPINSSYYTINVLDSNGCYTTDSIYVELDQTCDDTLVIPIPEVINNDNIAITPNGDGINDFLFLDGIDSTSNTVIIFDRWGDEMAIFTNYDNTTVFWGGTESNGNPAKEGTYFFTLEILTSGSKKSGWVQVLR